MKMDTWMVSRNYKDLVLPIAKKVIKEAVNQNRLKGRIKVSEFFGRIHIAKEHAKAVAQIVKPEYSGTTESQGKSILYWTLCDMTDAEILSFLGKKYQIIDYRGDRCIVCPI